MADFFVLAWQSLLRLRTELGNNHRLRIGVWLILLIVSVNGLLAQRERIRLAADDYVAVAARLSRAEQVSGQTDWSALQAQQEQLAAKWREGLWHAESVGLAQATLQAKLNEMVEGVGLRSKQIRLGRVSQVEGVEGVWLAQARLGGIFGYNDVVVLVDRLERLPGHVSVNRFVADKRSTRLDLMVSVYFEGIQP